MAIRRRPFDPEESRMFSFSKNQSPRRSVEYLPRLDALEGRWFPSSLAAGAAVHPPQHSPARQNANENAAFLRHNNGGGQNNQGSASASGGQNNQGSASASGGQNNQGSASASGGQNNQGSASASGGQNGGGQDNQGSASVSGGANG